MPQKSVSLIGTSRLHYDFQEISAWRRNGDGYPGHPDPTGVNLEMTIE